MHDTFYAPTRHLHPSLIALASPLVATKKKDFLSRMYAHYLYTVSMNVLNLCSFDNLFILDFDEVFLHIGTFF